MSMEGVYNLFFEPGEVVEIRALGANGKNPVWDGFARGDGTVFGYFDNAKDFGIAAEKLGKAKTSGVYFTINPCDPALLARASNRLIVANKKGLTTGNNHIKAIRWLPIDLDPKRPAGISSSKQELGLAKEAAVNVVNLLEKELGFPPGVRALSGNGYHVCYRLPDLENTLEISESKGLIHLCLAALQAKIQVDGVDIDQKVFNASRIWKLYGTMARKGDHTDDRPHRRSRLLNNAPAALADVPVVPLELLEKLAAMAPKDDKGGAPSTSSSNKAQPPAVQPRKNDPTGGDLGPLDVEKYLTHYGREIKRIKPDGDKTWFLLQECVFDPSHSDGEAAIVSSPNKPFLTYHCFHDSCNGRTWKDARGVISGSDKLAQFCENYDPNWKPAQQSGRNGGNGSGNGQGNGNGDSWAANLIITPTIEVGSDNKDLTPPGKVDPFDFFAMDGRKRGTFKEAWLANYLATWLSPVVSTAGQIWRYEGGVWKLFSDATLKQLIVQCMKNETRSSMLSSVTDVFKSAVNLEEENWPREEALVNVNNGMLDLSTLELKPHDPKYGSRVQLDVEFDMANQYVERSYPRWNQFLKEIFPGQPEKETILRQFFGYCLMPTCKYERALFLYGNGANGKSKVLEVLENMIGRQNCCSVSLSDLQIGFNIPYLKDKLVNIVYEEGGDRQPKGTSEIKKAISGDTMEGAFKYGQRISFKPIAKFLFAMNQAPAISDRTDGFSRKVIVLHFPRKFKKEERDPDLLPKLLAEKNGIFIWMVAGAMELMNRNGFDVDGQVEKDTRKFMSDIDPTKNFFDETVRVEMGSHVPKQQLFEMYKDWAKNDGIRTLGKIRFYHCVENEFPEVEDSRPIYNGQRERCFLNLAFKPVEIGG
ncbi:DNA primase family protein [Desulfatibacillum aliphaticivorans]|uniref:DNA primase family protein n=1 Tax=Desulfatibacillum aliphaticivorans TaxID=218208 RepID=UPI000417F9C0|nr:phage/plasmid primase, P4 family [Desulfatibacillum aliphaticivorans]